MPTIQEIILGYRQRLQALEDQAVGRLIDSYRRIYEQLRMQQDALLQEIAAKQARGESIGRAELYRTQRFRRLLAETEAQITRYGAVIEDTVRGSIPEAAQLGIEVAEQYIQLGLEGFPPEIREQIMGTFQRMPVEAVESMVGAMIEDSPLWGETLASLGEETARNVGDALVRNLLAGHNPLRTAREMATVWGVPLARARTIARTEQLRAHRLASLASYRQNAHIVKGWVWYANLDSKTCLACVALHGSRHGLDETMDDHPNGRCVMIPITPSWEDLGVEGMEDVGVDSWLQEGAGREWFAGLSEADQVEMMGKAKYEAWRNGAFDFDQLIGVRQHPRWGRTFYEASLQEIIGG